MIGLPILKVLQSNEKSMPKPVSPLNSERGLILFTALLFALIMSILGAIAYIITSNDSAISVNLDVSRRAFYSAEAGVHFALKSIETDLKTHAIELPSADEGVLSLMAYVLPSDEEITDIHFEYLPADAPVLTRTGENLYQFTVRGVAARNADAEIRVTLRKETAFKYGVFGNQDVTFPESSNFYGYDSSETPNPTGDDGNNLCHIGSNSSVHLSGNTQVHGYIGLGRNGTTEGVYQFSGSPAPQIVSSGDAVRSFEHILSDPLGAINGDYAQQFEASQYINDNGMIPSDTIVETGKTLTLKGKPGGAIYHFSKIELKKGATLNIDTTTGAVRIFLSGELNGKSGTINHTGGDPKNMTIFSNAADPISLSTSTPFYGVVYSPDADIEINNHGSIYGAILARSVVMKNAGNFYFDTSLKDQYLTNNVVMTSWLDVRM